MGRPQDRTASPPRQQVLHRTASPQWLPLGEDSRFAALTVVALGELAQRTALHPSLLPFQDRHPLAIAHNESMKISVS
ncbi:hypothetical protein [Dendronalium sp. ChiSLP03b]|uniref:hypothetical protein n=1 Tax=Dendronalium sp. ChiSLP03b TaxID=3075381 RepID=UPI002AD2470E|nr:hypothetical protein [Dendronalium sp. ChiSLP03b]MDZ8206373.1 hypothetical protein [Dendronalium sp. ChiSLP03b]